MSRKLIVLGLFLYGLAVTVLLLNLGRAPVATAAAPDALWGNPRIAIVADTTAGMQPVLNVVSGAFGDVFVHADRDPSTPNCHEVPCGPLTATYQLVGFRDAPAYLGSTMDAAEFSALFSSLTAEGGGACPDAALEALQLLARNTPAGNLPATEAMLLTNATPQGERQQYVYTANRLNRRGVHLHALQAGWCAGAPLSPEIMAFLALATGGDTYPLTATNAYTLTTIAFSRMLLSDRQGAFAGTVAPGEADLIPLAVDGTMTILGIDDDDPNANCPPWCCLTCTVRGPSSDLPGLAAPDMVQIQLFDPDGQEITPATPGVSLHTTGARTYLSYAPPVGTLPTGLWTVRVSGSGAYVLNFDAQSSLHLSYLGSRSVPAGRTIPIRALVEETSGALQPLTVTFRLVTIDGQQSLPIDLFDDGAHQDGDAGDGIYGGPVVMPAPGLWQLQAQGQLSDGSPFRRLDPTPIRARAFDLPAPVTVPTAPGSSRQIAFTLANDPTTRGGVATTFDLAVFSEQGWTVTDTVPVSVTLAPGESRQITVTVNIPADALPGSMEETTLVAVPTNDIGLGASTVAETTVSYTLYLPSVARKPA